MLACYRGRDWDGALATIERGRKTDEAHTLQYLYSLYEARIRAFQKQRRRTTGTALLRC